MIVKELINILVNADPDDHVYFSYGYGDHWNTEVADPVEEVVKENIKWSEYHNTYKVMGDEDSGLFKTAIILK
jgi:hypothetical protein